MGLDMYLSASKWISPYQHSKEDREIGLRIAAIIGLPPAPDPEEETGHVEGVKVRAGYWRKANQIHAWFVQHVQGGQDDCGDYRVSREQLQELRDLCQRVIAGSELIPGTIVTGYQYEAGGGKVATTGVGKVIEDSSLAQELLPAQAGFFFGSTEYDEWYLCDLEQTVQIIDRCLAMGEEWDFEYHSSW